MNYKETHLIKFGIYKPICTWSNNGEVHLGLPLFYDHPYYNQFSRNLGELSEGIEHFEKKYKVTLPISVDEYNKLFDNTQHPPPVPSRMPFHSMLPPRAVELRDYKYYIKHGQRFIVNVIADDHKFFVTDDNYSKPRSLEGFYIPEDLLTAFHNHQATLIFDQIREGHFQVDTCIEFMQNFAKKFKLTQSNFYIFTGNANAEAMCYTYASNKGEDLLFTPINTFHFEDTFWFSPNSDKFSSHQRNKHYTYFNDILQHKLTIKPEYHYLCLNRRLDVHRMAMFSELKLNPVHDNKSLVSLGNCYNIDQHQAESWVEGSFKNTVNYEGRKKFFENYDFTKDYVLDKEDFSENFATSLPLELHQKSFAPIVTETLRDDRAVFFSEKTYRPIYNAQPFFILGNRGMIHRLRDLGYKTFDKWWDESYDLENTWQGRFNSLCKVLEEVSKFTTTDLYYMYLEMEDILIHNFNVLMSKTRYRRIMDVLSKNTKPFHDE